MRYYSAPHGWQPICLRDIWDFRALILALATRDIQIRYRHTLVGIAWALVQPALTMIVFAKIFDMLGATLTSGQIPYFLFLFCGLIPWIFFASAISHATTVLVANQNLMTKVYFPRVLLPVSALIVNLMDAAFASGLFVALLLYWHIFQEPIFPGGSLLFLPIILLVEGILVAGCSIWLSALNAMYRDIEVIVPFFLQLGMFASPVVYDATAIIAPDRYWLYAVNPMVGILQAIRWSVLGQGTLPLAGFVWSTVLAIIVLVTGLFYFRRVEAALIDRI
jgi:lipopolysaccharide transport system permease protein